MVGFKIIGLQGDEKVACFTENELKESLKNHFPEAEFSYDELLSSGLAIVNY